MITNRLVFDSSCYIISTMAGPFSEEHKQKISLALRGKPRPWQEKEKVERTCECGIHFLLTPGQVRDGHGKYCSRSCYYKYRTIGGFPAVSHKLKGEKHWNYKGDKAGYKTFHIRVKNSRGKATVCEKCSSTSFVEWANLTGKYNDIFDYKSLCRSCHKKFDLNRKAGEVLA